MDLLSLVCPCFKSSSSRPNETELTRQMPSKAGSQQGSSSTSPSEQSLFYICKKMSAPTVQIGNLTVSGEGLGLVNVSIEQDCAYWEWHVESLSQSSLSNKKSFESSDDEDFFDTATAMKFGVATRKNRDFYKALDSNEDDDAMSMDDGTALMKPIPNVQHGDTIGIAVQQDDLPMIQFLLNGEPLHEIAINRFRGTVFPSIYLQATSDLKVTFVWDENKFKEMSPSVRFNPLIVARGMI
mmetsp:Transcript_14700/g.17893  ORF Transcript_14700/g.17893 Transcript_14700/m.17893 type:complete len:240 (-) Transcript_14700:266-985(-)